MLTDVWIDDLRVSSARIGCDEPVSGLRIRGRTFAHAGVVR
jgi:hypothetical protein